MMLSGYYVEYNTGLSTLFYAPFVSTVVDGGI